MTLFDAMLATLDRNAPATQAEIDRAEQHFNVKFPADYREFLLGSDGAEGPIGAEGYLVLWTIAELIELNESYEVDNFAPGLVLFGSDGGDEAYGFDSRDSAMPVVQTPFIGMSSDPEKLTQRGTFSEFLEAEHLDQQPTPTQTPRTFVPKDINSDAWKQLEQTLKSAHLAGKQVDMNVQMVNLPNADQRPLVLVANYSIDGQPTVECFQYHNGAEYDLSTVTPYDLEQALRNSLNPVVPADWLTITLEGQIPSDDHGILTGTYSTAKQTQQRFKPDYQLFFLLREWCHRADPPAKTITVILNSEGTMQKITR